MRKLKPNTLEKAIWNCAVLGCTYDEISRICGVSTVSLETEYKELIKDGFSKLKSGIRRAQIKFALKGNTALLIWLGKIYLHQKEAITVEHATDASLVNFVQSLRQNDPRLAEGPEEAPRISLPAQGRQDRKDRAVQAAA